MTPFKIIPAQAQKTTDWAGGTTTELFINPPEANYSARNFKFRISTAKVALEASSFTSLPGYKRILMPLLGTIGLSHEGQPPKVLEPFQQDTFDGGVPTTSKGKCQDFNLMVAKGLKGTLTALAQPTTINAQDHSFVGFYALKDQVTITCGPEATPHKALLRKGDFIHFTQNPEKIKFWGEDTYGVLVKVEKTN